MTPTRRGWLAAGLAVAVVGSLGLAGTLNAAADEVRDQPAATVPADATTAAGAAAAEPADPPADPARDASSATTRAELGAPPPLLPWGAEPAPITRAKAGATSDQVAAAGADAAPADTSGATVPQAEFAPKGHLNAAGGGLRTQRFAAPPAPPGVTPLAADTPQTVAYHYAGGRQEAVADGTSAYLRIGKPKLDKDDFHTLAEVAAQSADGKQIVEVGWTVDKDSFGDTDPHLFVFSWIDGVGQCYNQCGFIQYSQSVKPGDTLPKGGNKRFGLSFQNGAWWVAYDTEWVGAFPSDHWKGGFTSLGLAQWFGEVAAPAGQKPCSEMGNGLPVTDDDAARIGSVNYVNGPAAVAGVYTSGDYYKVRRVEGSSRSYYYGGPSPC